MKNQLEKYIKKKEKTEPKESRSVFLETRQVEFIERKNLNLSKLIRDFLNKLMKDENE